MCIMLQGLKINCICNPHTTYTKHKLTNDLAAYCQEPNTHQVQLSNTKAYTTYVIGRPRPHPSPVQP